MKHYDVYENLYCLALKTTYKFPRVAYGGIAFAYLQAAHTMRGGLGRGAPAAELRHARPSISTKKVRCHRELHWLQTAPFTLPGFFGK